MEQETLAEIIRRMCKAKSARAVAEQLGVHESTISLILSGDRKPGRKIAEALGYRSSVVFRRPS